MTKWSKEEEETCIKIELNEEKKANSRKLECCSSMAAGNKNRPYPCVASLYISFTRLTGDTVVVDDEDDDDVERSTTTHAKFFSTKIWTHRHRSHLKIYSRMMHGGFPLVTTGSDSHIHRTPRQRPTSVSEIYIYVRNENNDGATMIKKSNNNNKYVYQRRPYMCSRRNTFVHRRSRQRIRRRWHTHEQHDKSNDRTSSKTTTKTNLHIVCAHWSSESNWNKISKAKIEMNKSEKETVREREGHIRSRVVVCRSPFAVSI